MSNDYKTNRYDSATDALTFTDAQAHGFQELKKYYQAGISLLPMIAGREPPKQPWLAYALLVALAVVVWVPLALLSVMCMAPYYRYWVSAPIWVKIYVLGQELSSSPQHKLWSSIAVESSPHVTMKISVLNAGSSSQKSCLYEFKEKESLNQLISAPLF